MTPGPADVATLDLTPKLAALLVANDPRIVAEGIVALARATPVSQTERVAAVIRPRLQDERVLVSDASMLALGILRDRESVAPLSRLLADATATPCYRRQLAALALGWIGGDAAQASLLAVMHARLCPDLAGAALLGAAQASPDSTRVAHHALAILRNEAADTSARACAAVALSRLHGDVGRAALSHLVALVHDNTTPGELKASALLALGSLASPADAAAMSELLRAAQDGGAPRPRSLALVALGRVLERDGDRSIDAAARAPLFDLLRGSALRSTRHADRPWALLALGFALRGESDESVQRKLAVVPLRELVASNSETDERAAASIALGLMGDRAAGDLFATELTRRPQPRLETALLQGLGMLHWSSGAPAVRAVAFDVTLRADVRIEAARTLALMGDPPNDSEVLPRMAKELAATHDVTEAAVLCASLAKLRTTAAIDPLVTQAISSAHGQESTQRCAAAALGELAEGGASRAMPYWCAYSIDRDVELRTPVLRQLLPE